MEHIKRKVFVILLAVAILAFIVYLLSALWCISYGGLGVILEVKNYEFFYASFLLALLFALLFAFLLVLIAVLLFYSIFI